ncbi:hypothetical protein NKH58_26615 [Mesorhizobium australicum]|uniref:hypothetical protein n=1 Tax=Mesorhizobium australicum TaxID=536018 RepID=UPI00333AFD2C
MHAEATHCRIREKQKQKIPTARAAHCGLLSGPGSQDTVFDWIVISRRLELGLEQSNYVGKASVVTPICRGPFKILNFDPIEFLTFVKPEQCGETQGLAVYGEAEVAWKIDEIPAFAVGPCVCAQGEA